MDNSQKILHGPGIYYFRLTGARQQPVFRSVFEYDYATRILSRLDACTLLAYTFFEDEIHCVLNCNRDWPGVIDDIRDAFADLHERLWDSHKAIISEEVRPVLVDEHACLTDLVIALHQLPVKRRLLPDASMYPWSSDQYYRALTPPDWIDCGRVLNQVCQTRHNRALRYESIMANAADALSTLDDLSAGNHAEYLAFGRDAFIRKQLASTELTELQRSASELKRLREDAINLIAGRFGIEADSLRDRTFRRQYQRLMPLVAWLLQQRQLSYETIADLLDEDEDIIPVWLRGIDADHPASLTAKLSALWQPASPPPQAADDDSSDNESSDNESSGDDELPEKDSATDAHTENADAVNQ